MRKLKDDRSIWTYILLGTITFGIYAIWYLHCLVKDINELCREDGKRSSGVASLLLLGLVTCGVYGIFWWYRIGDMLSTAARRRGINVTVSGSYMMLCLIVNYFVCGIANLVGFYQVIEATNELANDYNSRLKPKPSVDTDEVNA